MNLICEKFHQFSSWSLYQRQIIDRQTNCEIKLNSIQTLMCTALVTKTTKAIFSSVTLSFSQNG